MEVIRWPKLSHALIHPPVLSHDQRMGANEGLVKLDSENCRKTLFHTPMYMYCKTGDMCCLSLVVTCYFTGRVT